MIHYKGRYIQKGFGLGGLFQSLPKIIRPIAREIIRLSRKPIAKKILKKVGKTAEKIGSDILIDSMKKYESDRIDSVGKLEKGKKEIAKLIRKKVEAHQKGGRETPFKLKPGGVKRNKKTRPRVIRKRSKRRGFSSQTVFD